MEVPTECHAPFAAEVRLPIRTVLQIDEKQEILPKR